MARPPRLALAGELHLLRQRGHNRQAVFVDHLDREAYLRMLHDAARQYGVAIHAYALLDADVYLLATPQQAASLGSLMQSLGRRYVAAFNRRHGRSGTLWAGRFRAGVIDSASLALDAMAHVELLPLRAGLAAAAADWPWSSAPHHLGRQRDSLIVEHAAYWALGNTPFERELAHAHRLTEGISTALTEGFEVAVMQGRALGSAEFTSLVSERCGRPQAVKRRGRPRRGA